MHFTQGRLRGLFFSFTSQREKGKKTLPVFQAGCLEDINWSILFRVGYENSSLPCYTTSHLPRKRGVQDLIIINSNCCNWTKQEYCRSAWNSGELLLFPCSPLGGILHTPFPRTSSELFPSSPKADLLSGTIPLWTPVIFSLSTAIPSPFTLSQTEVKPCGEFQFHCLIFLFFRLLVLREMP